MTANNQLEFKGQLQDHPVDELLVELSQKGLSGSLRLSSGDKKSIVYFEGGEVVFAVSNARSHRLYEVLLTQGTINKKKLSEIGEFTNDLHLAKSLVADGTFSKSAIDSVFLFQFGSILGSACSWTEGEFVFSASARIKSGVHFDFDLSSFLKSRLTEIPGSSIIERLSNKSESFTFSTSADMNSADLNPEDAFILSRFSGEALTAETLGSICGLSESVLLPTLYRLWFLGFIRRINWSSAISIEETEKLSDAKFELKTSARSFEEDLARAQKEAADLAEKEAEEARKNEPESKEVSLEKYLENVEKAATHYEIFDISPDSKIADVKKAYFSLAKRFHPDLFYKKVDDATHERVQKAFTETAQAYETLKDPESREVYDFKLRKVIEQLRESESGGESKLTREDLDLTGQASMAEENFDTGYEYLLNDNIEQATLYLARAAHIESENARYRAFYGRALSFDPDKQRQAEAEYQISIKLEPKNSLYRLMLAELFIDIGLKVRGRGELKRLLKLDPNHQEARHLLDTLEK